jgi:hypothetical protein
MIGFVKSSTIIAVLLLSATFAYAGNDLKAVHEGGNNMHPAPQGSKDTAVEMVGQHAQSSAAIEAVSKVQEDKLRRLRPVK